LFSNTAWVPFTKAKVVGACDIAVIGGGPAGAVAAFVLARAGLNVILLHMDAGEDETGHWGETISPAAAPILARLGLMEASGLAGMPHVTGFTSRWGSERTVSRPAFVVPDAMTVSVDRAIFDAALRSAAATRGAALVHGRVRALAAERHGWRLTCQNGDHIDTRLIVDASGRGGRFARRAGAQLLAFDKLVALTALFEPNRADRDRNVTIESVADGWLFTTLDARGGRVVSFFTDLDLWLSSELKRPSAILNRALASSETFTSYTSESLPLPTRIWSASTLVLPRAAACGILAVGDAAQTRDPLSSQGIGAAVEDAESAASLLAAHFETDLGHAIELHENQRRQRLSRYLTARCLYYRAEMRWSTHAFWQRRHDRDAIARHVRFIGQRSS
jgi:2-polyprenyl-6-methoxyphenol hydroxylase-like FAD-dependent oxidoreductase